MTTRPSTVVRSTTGLRRPRPCPRDQDGYADGLAAFMLSGTNASYQYRLTEDDYTGTLKRLNPDHDPWNRRLGYYRDSIDRRSLFERFVAWLGRSRL